MKLELKNRGNRDLEGSKERYERAEWQTYHHLSRLAVRDGIGTNHCV